jgi:hypothetical protein
MIQELITMGEQALSRTCKAGFIYGFAWNHYQQLKGFYFKGHFPIIKSRVLLEF